MKPLLALALLLGLAAPASAGKRVDWSEYIDPHPSRPIATQVAKAEPTTRTPQKASRAKTKVAKAKAVKARKKKARR